MSGNPRIAPVSGTPLKLRDVKFSCKEGKLVTTVLVTLADEADSEQEISYRHERAIGAGTFGTVIEANIISSDEIVAVKQVELDERFKNRELQIMRQLKHCNVVKLRSYFHAVGIKEEQVFLHLITDFMPATLRNVSREYTRFKKTTPIFYIKLFMYQLFRSLAYMHSLGICHRDVKPDNILVDPESGVVKLCDFGSAKQMVRGEESSRSVCHRKYCAPEILLGARNYTTTIDIWSAGSIFAELLRGKVLFHGDSGSKQLVEIAKVLGTPTKEQMQEMNPNYGVFRLPKLDACPWQKVFHAEATPEALDLVSKLLVYEPLKRSTLLQACAHAFFDELRLPETRLPNGKHLPPLFNFTKDELKIDGSLNNILIPLHIQNSQRGPCIPEDEDSSSMLSLTQDVKGLSLL